MKAVNLSLKFIALVDLIIGYYNECSLMSKMKDCEHLLSFEYHTQ